MFCSPSICSLSLYILSFPLFSNTCFVILIMAFPQRKRTPSFSSSVLQSIYRSIDESDGLQNDLRRSIDGNNDNVSSSSSPSKKDDKLTTLRRAVMDDEYWLYARSSTTNSSNSSAFSSSEPESYRAKRRSRKLTDQGNRSSDDKQRTKRTLVMENERTVSKSDGDKKHKALMLEDLKRPKQPVSPGARLTSFLNSIFQSNAKKVKLCSVDKTTDVKSCSSSRSCFSRTRYKTDTNNCNNFKSSVRFNPVRVTIDGDCRDSVHRNTTREKQPIIELTAKKSSGRVTSLKEEMNHKNDLTCIARKICLKDFVRNCRDEEEDDVWSYTSSDLFELNNHRIGMGLYIKELPVYETTDLKTNQAIARGLHL